MSAEQRAEIRVEDRIRASYEAFHRRDIDAVLEFFHPDIEWVYPDSLSGLGLGGTEHGHAGVRKFLAQVPSVLGGMRMDPEEFLVDGDRVAVFGTRLVTGLDGRSAALRFVHSWTLADGRAVRFEDHFDAGELLRLIEPDTAPASDAGRPPRPGGLPGADAEDAPDRLVQLGLGFWPAKVLLTALELGLYSELAAAGPADAATLTARLGLHERGARDFLDSQVALGLLDREDGVYRNAPHSATFLDRARDTYIGGLLEMAGEQWYRSWGNLTTALRTGQPQNNLAGKDGDPFDALYNDPELTRRFQKAMTGGSMAAAQALARHFPWAEFSRVVDVGCSEGILLSTVLAEHPHLNGVGFDLPQVAPSFQDTVARVGLADRLRFAGGSFLTDPLPPTDVIVFGRVLHDWGLETKRMLLAKAYEALAPGGAVVVYESMIDDDRRENAFGLLTSLHMLLESPDGFDYSGADCLGWMADAGFRDCTVRPLQGPVSVVVGRK
ncbi:methyltransferase [Streptomyces sp. NPDC093109]|uniref:methyltransferase n=1 Tax=Streptomyces sp. NPDC093109 TaxID=3154977 RepID=UPI0034507C46